MIKQLRYLCMLLLMAVASAAWADEESVTFSEQGYTNQQAIESYEGTNFTITFDKGTNSNAPKYFTNGTAIRAYGGNTFTVSSNYTITKIVLTFGGSDGTNEITTDENTYSNGTWIGSANSVTFTIGGTTGNRRLSGVKVTYTVTIGDKIATTISFGADAQSSYTVYTNETFNAPTATVSAGETVLEDATITYTSTNEDVATVDADGAVAIVAAGLTTIKATYAGDDTYAGSSASYTLNVGNIFANLHALQQGTTTTTAIPMKVTLTDVQVTGVNGKNAYINDGTYGAIIYTDGHGLSEGQTITGTLVASSQLYNGAPEITNFSTTGLTINAGTLTPQEKTISDLSVANEGIYVTIKGLSYDATAATFSDGTSTIAYYDGLKKEIALEDGGNYNVTGVINYRNLLQLYPTAVEKLEASVETPEFSLDAGSYKGTQTLTLTQPDNLPIYYTIDGTDPTESETAVLYTGAITIEQTTTVKAAAKSGDTWSNVITNTYTIVHVYANIAALKDAITATSASDAVDMYVTLTDAVVTYINGSNYYIEDATAGILIYNNSQGVKDVLTAAGIKLNGDMKAAGYIYNGLYELTKNFDFTDVTITGGAEIPVTEVSLAALNENIANYESKRVKVVDASVTSVLASRKATITQNGNSIQIYEKASGKLAETALATENATVTVIGYPGINNNINQLNVWDVEDVIAEETPVVLPVPTFSPAAGEVEVGTEITINEGDAEFCVYTTDGTDPTYVDGEITNGTRIYATEKIAINADVTIKAIAVDAEGNVSAVATAVYTIKAETPAQDVVIVEEDKTTFLFNTEGNEWGFPDGSANKTTEESSYTYTDKNGNDYVIILSGGGSGNGHYYNKTSRFLLMGKSGAILTLPAFDFPVGKIEITGNKNASASVKQNIFVGNEAVSTETTGAGTDDAPIVNTYVINKDYQAAGNVYTLKVTSSHNTQITQIVVYKATGQEKADPQLKFSDTSATATLGSDFVAPTLSYVEGFDGTVIYESSDPDVATVDEEGNVTIVAVGVTTIAATSEATPNYLAGEASYTLTVNDPNALEAMFNFDDDYATLFSLEGTSSSESNAGDITEDVTAEVSGILLTVSAAAEDATTPNRIWNSSPRLRMYSGTLTVAAPAGYLITGLEFNDNAKWNDGNAADSGTLTNKGWAGEARTVVITIAANTQLKYLNVLYKKADSAKVGDVNKDGYVTIADVTALVNILLNKDTTAYDHVAADVDGENGITIADVTALVNIILGKTN